MGMRHIVSATCLVLALVTFGCGSSNEVIPAEKAHTELIDRNWLDTWPESRDDRLQVFRFTPSMGGGVHQERTVYEGSFELFTFTATGDTIRFVFPGRDEVHETAYRIEEVDGPAPFTRRLVLEDSPRGPGVYYGWDEGSTAGPFVLDGGSPLSSRSAEATPSANKPQVVR